MDKNQKKLVLRKETIRDLTNEELAQVAGGLTSISLCGPVPATGRGSGCGETAVTITVCRVNCL